MPLVKVKDNEYFDYALRRFKRACEKAGIVNEYRKREFYEKPTQEKKRKKAAAVKRERKRVTREHNRSRRLYWDNLTLITQIQDHVKDAMKAGDRLKLSTLRMLVAAIKQKEIDTRSDISDDDIISIIEKQMQQRLEAAEQYEAAGRNELFEKESQEAEILKAYLPEKMGEEEVKEMIEKIISEMGGITMKEMGNVMSALKNQAGSKIDMKLASQMVREIIARQSN